MKFKKSILVVASLVLLTGCSPKTSTTNTEVQTTTQVEVNSTKINTISTEVISTETATSSNVYSVENYNGTPYVEVNGNVPFFTEDEKNTNVFESYSDLDDLGRCGVAYANLCTELMPTEERGAIGSIKPSGWHTSNYNEYKGLVDGNYLYNRCHLIAFMLAGENANNKNLITGTRYLNINGMLPFEDKAHDYLKANPNNHVLYRVTPIYNGNDLVAQGVLMEAYSVEDNGSLQFCVFCYNVQPHIVIDYSTGDNHIEDGYDGTTTKTESKVEDKTEVKSEEKADWEDNPNWYTYVLNENSKKIHKPDCSSVSKIAKDNKTETNRSYEELISEGYEPCGICHPEN